MPNFQFPISPNRVVHAWLRRESVIASKAPNNYKHALINLLRGNVIREVSNSLPEEIDLLVYA